MTSFNEEKINSGRQIEWDYAKVLAIALMIIVHYAAFCSFGTLDYGILTEYMFILLQCSAPIFMFAMGIGMIYTRHDSPREFIIRGFKLLALGLIINTLYFLSNYSAGVPLEYSLLSFLANDILQFAGLSFIVIGIFKKFDLTPRQIFFISILFSLISSYDGDFTLSNLYMTQLLGNIFSTSGQNVVSCFPLLNWLVVPACGMMFGEDLINCSDKDHLYSKLLKICGATSVIMLIVGLITREGMFSTVGGTVPEKIEYLHASNADIFILIIAVMFISSILYFLSKKSSPRLDDFIVRNSKHVTIIYIIQWFIILSLTYINQFLQVKATLPIAISVLIFVFVATWVLTEAYVKIRDYLIN